MDAAQQSWHRRGRKRGWRPMQPMQLRWDPAYGMRETGVEQSRPIATCSFNVAEFVRAREADRRWSSGGRRSSSNWRFCANQVTLDQPTKCFPYRFRNVGRTETAERRPAQERTTALHCRRSQRVQEPTVIGRRSKFKLCERGAHQDWRRQTRLLHRLPWGSKTRVKPPWRRRDRGTEWKKSLRSRKKDRWREQKGQQGRKKSDGGREVKPARGRQGAFIDGGRREGLAEQGTKGNAFTSKR